MKTSKGAPVAKRRGFLLLYGSLSVICLALIIFAILFAMGYWHISSDGGFDKTKHELTGTEHAQITKALASQYDPYPCINNTQDTCTYYPAVAYYPLGFDVVRELKEYTPNSNNTLKQIYGEITNIDGETITLKTSSGRSFTVEFPASTRANFFNNYEFKFDIHNLNHRGMLVTYQGIPGSNSTHLETSRILGSSIGGKFPGAEAPTPDPVEAPLDPNTK